METINKQKLLNVMDAAISLTALGEEGKTALESEVGHSQNDSGSLQKKRRFLPDHKKPDAAPTFPEKMMALMRYAETKGDNFCVSWLDDGQSFIITDTDEFTRDVVPKFFKPTKFSSFTRKLYRWGFRQINRGIGQDDPVVFGNENFQKDKPELMANMRSTTAAATRKAEEHAVPRNSVLPQFSTQGGVKRRMEDLMGPVELQQQLLLSELLRKKGRFGNQHEHPSSLSHVSTLYSTSFPQLPVGESLFRYGDGVSNNTSLSLQDIMGSSLHASQLVSKGLAQNSSLSLQSMMRPNIGVSESTAQAQLRKNLGGIIPTQVSHNDSLLSQFFASNGRGLSNGVCPSSLNGFPPTSTTSDIVTAAIEALRYS